MKINRIAAAIAGVAVLAGAALTASASHSWSTYHWATTTSGEMPLQVIDSNTSDWDDELGLAISQWNQSTELSLRITGYDDSSRARKQCRAVSGKIRSCNAAYGNNGWLGLASINLDSRGHIVQGTSKMNDSYSSYFADPNERKHVMCQELGHLFGLGHTSEDGSSQNTCMDYSSSPNSTAPNAHDYDMLKSIYAHIDSYNSYSTSLASSASGSENSMAGQVPMGIRVHRGVFSEVWAAADGKGGTWIHHVTLAPGHEHTDHID
jgi:hypothetical protein